MVVKSKLLALAREAHEKYGDASIGLEAALIGTNKHLKGGSKSVEQIQNSLLARYWNGIMRDLEGAEGGSLTKIVRSGELDREISRGLEKITKHNAPGTTNAQANQIAAIFHKWRKEAFNARNRSGSYQKALDGYITRQSHDVSKMMTAGPVKWREYIKPRLDPRTFDGIEDVDKFLDEAYKSIVSNSRRTDVSDLDVKFAFEGPGNLAKRTSSQHRKLHFKNADEWFDYNKEFGRGNFAEAMFAEFRTMAEDTGLMMRLGTNPEAMVNKIKDRLSTEFAGDVKLQKSLSNDKFERWLTVVDGSYRNPQNITGAKIGQLLRGIQNWSKLGTATVSSITDIAMMSSSLRYLEGGGWLGPLAKAFTNVFQGMNREMRINVASSLNVGLDGVNGMIVNRVGVGDDLSGAVARGNNLFFRLTGLTWWTDSAKAGMAMSTSNYLALNASKAFDQLPVHLKGILNDFDIDARRWEILRNTVEDVKGRSFMLPEKLQHMDDSIFAAHGIDPRLVRSERDDIGMAFSSLINDFVERAVPTPGARERATLIQGFKPGTIPGEVARTFAQFKSFPFTVVNKSVGRLLNSHGDQVDIMGIAQMIAHATILGYFAIQAKNMIKGKEPIPTDLSDWKSVSKIVTASMLQGGALGIYGDFLFGGEDRYGRSVLEDIGGPTAGSIGDGYRLYQKVLNTDGEAQDKAAAALRVFINHTPNILATRQVLDYLVMYSLQEMLNPGYLKRMEKNTFKKTGQRYLFPPSQFAN